MAVTLGLVIAIVHLCVWIRFCAPIVCQLQCGWLLEHPVHPLFPVFRNVLCIMIPQEVQRKLVIRKVQLINEPEHMMYMTSVSILIVSAPWHVVPSVVFGHTILLVGYCHACMCRQSLQCHTMQVVSRQDSSECMQRYLPEANDAGVKV